MTGHFLYAGNNGQLVQPILGIHIACVACHLSRKTKRERERERDQQATTEDDKR